MARESTPVTERDEIRVVRYDDDSVERGQAWVASGVNLLAGIWLVLAPFVLNYPGFGEGGGEAWNDVVIGSAIAILALVRVLSPIRSQSLSWVNFVLGAWLVVAPFAVGYEVQQAATNDVIIGIIVLAMAAWSALAGQAGQES